MRMQELKSELKEGKKLLVVGMALLLWAAVLIVALLKLDTVTAWFKTVAGALSPLLCGIVVAYVLNVFVRFFEDFAFLPLNKLKSKHWEKAKRPLAVLLAYLVVVLLILFISCFIVPGLIESMGVLGDTMQETLPKLYQSALAWVTAFAAENDLTFVQDFIKNFNWNGLLSNISQVTGGFVGSLVSMTANVANALYLFVMGFIFSIYLLFGKEKLLRSVKSSLVAFLPEKTTGGLMRVGAVANQVFYSFIRGQLAECVILGSLCYIGMSILGLEYALLISSIVALSALIPILGAYIGAAAGMFILLLVNPIDSLIFLIFLLVLQQVEGNLIYPRVVGSSIGLPPVWTLFAILFWGSLLGIPGILIGTPATAVVYRLFRTSVYGRLKEKHINPQDPRLSAPVPVEEDGQQSFEDLMNEEGKEST